MGGEGNFPVLACHFHKLAVTWPGLSSGKFRVRSHERFFPFPLGGGSPLPSRSSLRITLGPSAYGYVRTGNFWSPHREKKKALQWLNLRRTSRGDESGPTRAPLFSFLLDSARSCGCFVERRERRAFERPRYRQFQDFDEALLHLPFGWSLRFVFPSPPTFLFPQQKTSFPPGAAGAPLREEVHAAGRLLLEEDGCCRLADHPQEGLEPTHPTALSQPTHRL